MLEGKCLLPRDHPTLRQLMPIKNWAHIAGSYLRSGGCSVTLDMSSKAIKAVRLNVLVKKRRDYGRDVMRHL